MTGVGDNSTVFHHGEMFFVDHVDVTGNRAEEVADLGSFNHGHHTVTVHHSFESFQRVDLGDDNIGAHTACPAGQTTAAPTITNNHKDFTGQQYVGGADDAIDGRLTGAVTVVKEVFGHGIVDSDNREVQGFISCHGTKANNAGSGLFGTAEDFRQQFAVFFMQSGDQVRTVIHGDLRFVS
jgi:hypothetical protein